MKNQTQRHLISQLSGSLLLLLLVGMACNVSQPTPTNTGPNLQVGAPNEKIDGYPTSAARKGWVTFIGKDDLYTLALPKDWLTIHAGGPDYQFAVDQFLSADKNTLMEIFVSDDGRPFPNVDEKYTYALSVLERVYSHGVNVEKRLIEEDNRETLVWNTQEGRFFSAYDVTNKTTFVMLTIFDYTPEKAASSEIQDIITNFKVQQSGPR